MGQRVPLAIAGVAAALALAAAAAAAQECAPDRLDLRAAEGGTAHRFAVEIADDDRERALGLMNRRELPADAGMLFVFPAPGPRAFWMKNTHIPLDLLFADETGTIRAIGRGKPLSLRPIPGGDAIQYVLEINAGTARRLGVAVGGQIRHPAIDRGRAAWPCP